MIHGMQWSHDESCQPQLTRQQIERVIDLKERLARLALWGTQRAKGLVEHYKALTSSLQDSTMEDLELRGTIEFYRALTTEEDNERFVSHDGLILRADFLAMPPLNWTFWSSPQRALTKLWRR